MIAQPKFSIAAAGHGTLSCSPAPSYMSKRSPSKASAPGVVPRQAAAQGGLVKSDPAPRPLPPCLPSGSSRYFLRNGIERSLAWSMWLGDAVS